jgi:uncharacterized protein (DUF1778 family)
MIPSRAIPFKGLLYGILPHISEQGIPDARNSARSTRLETRLSPQALALIKRAAEIEGRSVNESSHLLFPSLRAASASIKRSSQLASERPSTRASRSAVALTDALTRTCIAASRVFQCRLLHPGFLAKRPNG